MISLVDDRYIQETSLSHPIELRTSLAKHKRFLFHEQIYCRSELLDSQT